MIISCLGLSARAAMHTSGKRRTSLLKIVSHNASAASCFAQHPAAGLSRSVEHQSFAIKLTDDLHSNAYYHSNSVCAEWCKRANVLRDTLRTAEDTRTNTDQWPHWTLRRLQLCIPGFLLPDAQECGHRIW